VSADPRAGFLLVSPCLCGENHGGIQVSGRVTRDALARTLGAERFRCLAYATWAGPHESTDCISSRLQAAWKAARLRNSAGTLLFWHIGLLKLLPLLRSRQTRTFLFLHGVECWGALDAATQYLLRFVDVFVTNSVFTWERFVEKHPRWRDTEHKVVALGLGEPDNREVAPAAVPAALMVGRMCSTENYKGHRELVGAWPAILRQIPTAELWIAGGGDLAPELKRMANAAGIAKQIRFFGLVSEEEKERLICAARCLALPSRGEGFGLVYLEAMRHGRPCLASDVDAGREVVSPPIAGLCCSPKDPVAISEAVIRLVSPGEEWAGWAAKAKARYESAFTAAHFEKRMLLALGVGNAGVQ
jgi:phosphatidyl-myo-inositol dimannoside synthase